MSGAAHLLAAPWEETDPKSVQSIFDVCTYAEPLAEIGELKATWSSVDFLPVGHIPDDDQLLSLSSRTGNNSEPETVDVQHLSHLNKQCDFFVDEDNSNHSSNFDLDNVSAESSLCRAQLSPDVCVTSPPPAGSFPAQQQPPVLAGVLESKATLNVPSVIIRKKSDTKGGVLYSIRSAAPPLPVSPQPFCVRAGGVQNTEHGVRVLVHGDVTSTEHANEIAPTRRRSECGESDLLASFLRCGQAAGINFEALLPEVFPTPEAFEKAPTKSPAPTTSVAELHRSLVGTSGGGAVPPAADTQPPRPTAPTVQTKKPAPDPHPRRVFSQAGPGTNRPPKEGSLSAKLTKEKLSRKRAAARRYYHNQKNKVFEYEEVVRALEAENKAVSDDLRAAIKRLDVLKKTRAFLAVS
eukprot:scaffold394_cov41-Prasinocladus_malaysianus.AAC.2